MDENRRDEKTVEELNVNPSSELDTAEHEKAKRKAISAGVGTACAFAILLFLFNVSILPFDKDLNTAIVMLVLAAVLCLINRKAFPEGWPLKSGQTCSLDSFLIAAGIFGLYHLIINLLSGSSAVLSDTPGYLIFMGVATPIAEELVFRGCVMERFKPYGYAFTIIGSSILFGLYHLNPIQTVSGFCLGLVLCYMALKYSVKYSIALHALNNLVLALLLPILSNRIGNSYVELGLEGLLAVAGIVAFIRRKPVPEIKAFVSSVKNEDNVYKYLFLNGWFLLIVIAMILGGVLLGVLVASDPELSFLQQ